MVPLNEIVYTRWTIIFIIFGMSLSIMFAYFSEPRFNVKYNYEVAPLMGDEIPSVGVGRELTPIVDARESLRRVFSNFYMSYSLMLHSFFILYTIIFSFFVVRPLNYKYVIVDSYLLGSLVKSIIYRIMASLMLVIYITLFSSIAIASIMYGVWYNVDYTQIVIMVFSSLILLVPSSLGVTLLVGLVIRDHTSTIIAGFLMAWFLMLYGANSSHYESPLITINLLFDNLINENYMDVHYAVLSLAPLVLGIVRVLRYEI